MLNRLEREQLLRRWEEIEQELELLADVPAGRFDPAERERRLLESQDLIECLFAWHFDGSLQNEAVESRPAKH